MIRSALLIAALLAAMQAFAQGAARDVTVLFDGELVRTSREGHTQLIWVPDPDSEALRFELQSDTAPNFPDPRTRYRGVDRGSFVSGLSEGETFFRVRATDPDGQIRGPWSDTLSITVRYAPWWQVRTLMLIGIVVFLATVGAVITGHRRHGTGSQRTGDPEA